MSDLKSRVEQLEMRLHSLELLCNTHDYKIASLEGKKEDSKDDTVREVTFFVRLAGFFIENWRIIALFASLLLGSMAMLGNLMNHLDKLIKK